MENLFGDAFEIESIENVELIETDPNIYVKRAEEELKNRRYRNAINEIDDAIKYSKDKKRLTEFLTDNPRMLMEANAARVIKAVTNTPLDIPEDAEVIDVCKAVEDMMNESKTEGAVAVLAGLVKDGLLSIKEAAHRANMTESAFEAEVKKLS